MKAQHKWVSIAVVSAVLSALAVTMAIPHFSAGKAASEDIASVRSPTGEPDGAGEPALVPNQGIPGDTLTELNREAHLQRLEQRVDELVATMRSGDALDDPDDFEAELNKLTPEEARAAHVNRWEETKVAFEQEVVDEEWASATSQLFESDVSQLMEESGFSMARTECRSTQCAVVTAWPSYGEATAGFAKLLHHPYEANCARRTLLPEPTEEDADQPYEMTVIFDCSEWREQR